jgi:CheY-like chemotaxis protein
MKQKGQLKARYNTVMLIDEDQIDNFINERMITSTNFAENVIVKPSAMEGLEYLRDILENNKTLPELIFLDLNMPVMNGFGFLEEFDHIVKQFPHLKEDCKIIVLSSSISAADIDRASTNPYVRKYLNKPLSQKYLDVVNL